MPTSAAFVENRTANTDHFCTQCPGVICPGDHYIREAIPPWAFRYRDQEDQLVDEGDGLWLIIKRCWDCLGLGGSDAIQSTPTFGW